MCDDKDNIEQEKIVEYKKTYIFIGFIIISFFLILFVLYAPKNLAKFEKNKPNKEITKTETPACHNCFILGPDMKLFHNGPSVLLDDGNVLVLGGNTKQAEIYDYKKNKFIFTKGEMNYIRQFGATATKLNNGKVLITGGDADGKSFDAIPNEEIYDPNTGIFSKIPNMCIPRTDHTAILMDNGNVLIFGGNNKKVDEPKEIEEFNYQDNTFKVINKIDVPNHRWEHFVNIGNNKVLLIGFDKSNHGKQVFYIYDYDKNKIYKFEPKQKVADVDIKRDIYATNSPLNTRILYWTDKNGAVIIDRQGNDIVNISFITEKIAEQCYTSTLLDKNEVIFIGGYDDKWGWGLRLLKHISLYTNNTLITQNIGLNIPRYNHQAIKLNNGNIIIIGGYKDNNGIGIPLKTIEIYYK